MKVSLTHYGMTNSVEVDRDDLTLPEVLYLVKALLWAAGFDPTNVSCAIEGDRVPETEDGTDDA